MADLSPTDRTKHRLEFHLQGTWNRILPNPVCHGCQMVSSMCKNSNTKINHSKEVHFSFPASRFMESQTRAIQDQTAGVNFSSSCSIHPGSALPLNDLHLKPPLDLLLHAPWIRPHHSKTSQEFARRSAPTIITEDSYGFTARRELAGSAHSVHRRAVVVALFPLGCGQRRGRRSLRLGSRGLHCCPTVLSVACLDCTRIWVEVTST